MEDLCLRKLVSDEGFQAVMVSAGAQGVDLDSLVGSDSVTFTTADYKDLLDQMGTEQAEVNRTCRDFFIDKFKKLDEGSGLLTAESFKMALSELEAAFNMNFQTDLVLQ